MGLTPEQKQIIEDATCALGDNAGSARLREITIACEKILTGDLEPALETLREALVAWWLEFESFMSGNPAPIFGQFRPAPRHRTKF